MKKSFNFIILFFSFHSIFANDLLAISANELLDATGTKVKLLDHPSRIVTLVPSLAELTADILGDDIEKIVGVSEYTNYPPALKTRISIGPYYRFNIEKVVSLKPDLVLATTDGNPKDQVLHLRELGIPVLVVKTGRLREIEDSILIVARALGKTTRGDQMLAQFRQGIDRIRERAKKREKKKTLVQVGGNPLVVVGGKSFLNEAIEIIGATNLYQDAKQGYPKPGVEDVVKRNPEIILVLAMDENLVPFWRMAGDWQQFKLIEAVKKKRVYVMRGDAILRPTLRLLEGLSILEKTIYGQK